MANIGSKGILQHIDDPSTSIVSGTAGSTVTWLGEAGGSATLFVRAVEAGKGVHYKGVMDAVDNSLLEFASNNLYFAVQEGHCAVEILIQFEDASEHAFTFGFNDTCEDTNLPIDLSGTTLAATADDFCGFVYDGTDATNKDLHCVWVDATTIATTDADGSINGQAIRMSGMAPTDAKWFYMKVEMQDRGSGNDARVTFMAADHTGKSAEKVFNTTVLRTIPFCYHLAIENRTATGGDVFLRGCNWEQSIADM